MIGLLILLPHSVLWTIFHHPFYIMSIPTLRAYDFGGGGAVTVGAMVEFDVYAMKHTPIHCPAYVRIDSRTKREKSSASIKM